VTYNSPGSHDYSCSVAASTGASSPFDIDAASTPTYCGGTATLTYTYQNVTGSISFTILGQSPDVDVVRAQLGSSPWYIQQLANSESPGYQQFQSNGYPIVGAPNGYGIMQIDYANTVYDLWTWTTNVFDGKNTIQANWTVGD
jgi:hypothetical protein